MVQHEEEVRQLFGSEPVDFILNAVDTGGMSLDEAKDIAEKMDPGVGGKLKRRSQQGNFEWKEREMRLVLSSWFNNCCPANVQEEDDMRKKLVSVLKSSSVEQKSLALEIENF